MSDESEMKFDEYGLPLGVSQAPIQNFFFLIFYSNPQREFVYIYPDGDDHKIMMSHTNFLDFIISLTGYAILPRIHEAISSYGTLWLYDRERNMVRRISMKGADDIKTIQGQIQKAYRRETTPEQNPLNPAEGLTYTPVNIQLPQGKNPFARDTDDDTQIGSPTIKLKK